VDTFSALLNEAENNDPPIVQRLLETALRAEMPKYIAARYLTPYGMDMPAFLNSRGPSGFTDERWNELSRLMLDFSDSYDVELLVSGWGQTQEEGGATYSPRACLYSVSRDGVTPHSDDGFYACGSGKEAAHSVLSFFNHERHMTLAEAIYNVATAKFMAERTAGVGKNTVLRVATRLGEGGKRLTGYYLQSNELNEIRELWEKDGAPRMRDGAEDTIVSIIARHQKSQHVSINHMVRNVNKAIKQSVSEKSEPEP